VHLVWVCRGGGAFSGWAGDALRRVKSGPHAGKFHLHLFDTAAAAAVAADSAGGANGKQPALISAGPLPSPPAGGIFSPSQQAHSDRTPAAAAYPQLNANAEAPPPTPQAEVAEAAAAPSLPTPPQPLHIQPGRPDLASLMESLSAAAAAVPLAQLPPHHAVRQSGARGHSVALLACGPAPLVAVAQREAAARGFHCHKETFAL
jgi:hypothetical protein